MKIRDRLCILFAILASLPNFLLLQALSHSSPIYGKDSIIITIGITGFFIALVSVFFGIPYYDDDSNQKRPLTGSLLAGITLGIINLIVILILTPGVIFIWGSSGLQKIIASLM